MKIRSMVCLGLILVILASPAWAGCGRWVVRDNTDFLDDPLFDAEMESSTGSNATASSNSSLDAGNGTEEKMEEPTSAKAAIVQEDPAIDLAGKWRIRMPGSRLEGAGKLIDIILIPAGDRLQGYGNIIEGSDVPVTATGSISQDRISLEVKAREQKRDYRLNLQLVGGQLLGSYEVYENESLAESGNATASRS